MENIWDLTVLGFHSPFQSPSIRNDRLTRDISLSAMSNVTTSSLSCNLSSYVSPVFANQHAMKTKPCYIQSDNKL